MKMAIVILFILLLLVARLFNWFSARTMDVLVDSKISKIWYLAINFATSFWMNFFLKYKSVTHFSAKMKYGRNLFITHLPRKMNWDSYFLSVFCSAENIVPLSILFLLKRVFLKFWHVFMWLRYVKVLLFQLLDYWSEYTNVCVELCLSAWV